MTDNQMHFGRPMLDDDEVDAVVRVLKGTQYVHGPVTAEFERKFAERAGAKHAIAVSSCTAGLHLSLFVRDVGPGDEVIVPAMTHVATAHSVEFCRAKPVFVDVQPDTGNIDPDLLSASISGRTRAAMVVHFLGLPCEMDKISAAIDKAGAFVVEDCAIAIDATYAGKKVGNFGMTGCFSFYPIKHMTTIEGGMVVTNDDKVAKLISSRKAFGYDRNVGERAKPGIYDVTALGYNYRMNEVEAAVGVVQLDKLDRFQTARAANYKALAAGLAEINEVMVFSPKRGEAASSHYCLNAILPKDNSIDRDAVVANLKALGIGTSVHYPSAVPLFSYYREKYGHKVGQFPVAEWIAAQSISLPVGPHLDPESPRRIADAMKASIHKAKVS
jgi:perosamine synthetase